MDEIKRVLEAVDDFVSPALVLSETLTLEVVLRGGEAYYLDNILHVPCFLQNREEAKSLADERPLVVHEYAHAIFDKNME